MRILPDAGNAKGAYGEKPYRHEGAESSAELGGAEPLYGEESEENGGRNVCREWLEGIARDFQAFDGAEYGDRWRDDTVAVE